MTAAALFAVAMLSVAGQPDIQGLWTGAGRYPQFTAVFCDDMLAIRVGTHPLLETRESRFSVDPEQGTLDIERAEGLQLGRYAIEGNKLTIMLADVNLPRPASIDFPAAKPLGATVVAKSARSPSRSRQQYVFERK